MNVFQLSEIKARRDRSGQLFLEFLRGDNLSVGLYELEAGSLDPQQPHTEDEVYYVVDGRGSILVGEESQPVGPGTLVFVGKGVEHRFHSITEDLSVLVVFAPPRGSAG